MEHGDSTGGQRKVVTWRFIFIFIFISFVLSIFVITVLLSLWICNNKKIHNIEQQQIQIHSFLLQQQQSDTSSFSIPRAPSSSSTSSFSLSSSTLDEKKPFFLYTETNPLRKETRFGLALLPQSLLDEEYIFYTNKATKNQIIISNLSDQNFECEGACFCGETETSSVSTTGDIHSNSRRISTSSSVLLSRGLLVVFLALSVSIARKFAKETFRENCIQHFSSLCDPDLIISEVSTCNSINSAADPTISNTNNNFEFADTDNSASDEPSPGVAHSSSAASDIVKFEYRCTGSCSPSSSNHKGANDRLESNLGSGGCEELKVSGMVTSKFSIAPFDNFEDYNQEHPFSTYMKTKRTFLDEHMTQFCTDRSKSSDEDGKEISFCVASMEDVSCKPTDGENEDHEELFVRGLKHFMDQVKLMREKYEGRDTPMFRIDYSNLYVFMVKISEEEYEEIEKQECKGFCRTFKVYWVNIGFEYRGHGFFQRLLGEIEVWAATQEDITSTTIVSVQNPEFKSHLKKLDYDNVPGHSEDFIQKF